VGFSLEPRFGYDHLRLIASILEAKKYLRVVVFRGNYQGRNLHLIIFRPTEESLPILEKSSDAEWDLAKPIQRPAVFEDVPTVHDSKSK